MLISLLCSVLGWVPGIITMLLSGALFWITSITMHKFIMKYPQIRDICKTANLSGKHKIHKSDEYR